MHNKVSCLPSTTDTVCIYRAKPFLIAQELELMHFPQLVRKNQQLTSCTMPEGGRAQLLHHIVFYIILNLTFSPTDNAQYFTLFKLYTRRYENPFLFVIFCRLH